ncbi:MAG: sulfatase-like hydrolase/transferase [Opitutaceae bacterium]
MKRSTFCLRWFQLGCSILVGCGTWVGAATSAPGATAGRPPPNIVFILADDLGISDLHCYGSAWHDTPNLDRLARQGRRFTSAYAPAPICSASRAALLTGRSPARLGLEFVIKDPPAEPPTDHLLQPPPYPRELPLSEVTLAEVLGPAGYATGYFGKWHLNPHAGAYLKWSNTLGPLQQGYAEGDETFGSHPYSERGAAAEPRPALAPGEYGRDALTEKAVAFLRAHRQERFFLHLSHYYVHDPIRTRAAWLVEKYQARLPAGADPRRAAYAAMVETLDHLVGQVLQELDALGLSENTLVVFTSDNGGHPVFAANGPSRGSKWNLYEGGIRVPWIVRWPGVIPTGTESGARFIGTDLLPTLCAVANTPPPTGVRLDGENILPLWTGAGVERPDRSLLWHFPYYHPEVKYGEAMGRIGINDFAISQTRPHSVLRSGDHVLVHFWETGADELYDTARDPGQQVNLVATQPEVARQLRTRLDAALKDQGARSAKVVQPNYASRLAAKVGPTRTVVYRRFGNLELTLDLFLPAGHQPTDRRPAFILFHGGGWTSGAPRVMYPHAHWASQQGWVGISVRYRLFKAGTEVSVFECVKDARAAVRYVRAHAAELGIDPQRLAVGGASAGGHLAAATAQFAFDHEGEPAGVSCTPNALVLFSPVIDTSAAGYGQAKIGERWRELSPLHQVRTGLPPTLVFHGTADSTTPFAGAQGFHDAMVRAGNGCVLDVKEGGPHTYLFKDADDFQQSLTVMTRFFTSLGW